MKANEIEEKLKKVFVGQSCDHSIYQTVYECLRSIGIDTHNLSAHTNKYERNKIYFCVTTPHAINGNGVSFLEVLFKRKRGEKHRTWFGSYYDWTYSDFSVYCGVEETVEAAHSKAVETIKNKIDLLYSTEDKAKKIVEFLRDNGYSQSDAANLLRYAGNNNYSLCEAVYKNN